MALKTLTHSDPISGNIVNIYPKLDLEEHDEQQSENSPGPENDPKLVGDLSGDSWTEKEDPASLSQIGSWENAEPESLS